METKLHIVFDFLSKCCLKNDIFGVHFALQLLQKSKVNSLHVFMDSFTFFIEFFENQKNISSYDEIWTKSVDCSLTKGYRKHLISPK